MSWRFRVDDAVWAEIADAVAWYDRQRSGLGQEFLGVIEDAFVNIHESPERWPRWRADREYRRRVLPRFPFSVFYEVDATEITIVAVAHHKRLPGYWLG